MPAEFVLGFAAYAADHPEVGTPVENEWTERYGEDGEVMVRRQDTSKGSLRWYVESNQIIFSPNGLYQDLPEVPTEITVLRAMDVSSHQDRDLTHLINTYQPDHVIVKLYQEIESPPKEHSIAQLRSAILMGCTVAGYVWLYHGLNIETQVAQALSVASEADVKLPILWVDCETYEGEGPTFQEILDACYYIEMAGYRAGIYTGDWYFRDILKMAPNHTGLQANYPVWLANYNGQEDLDIHSNYWPDEMIVAHQYQGNPIDLSAIRSDYTVAQE